MQIISADSRQLYKSMPIGTAAPTPQQLQRVKHHFVNILNLTDYYSAARFEEDVLNFLSTYFETHQFALLTGGSMMYIDAICKGIDDLPTVDPELRKELMSVFEQKGIDAIRSQLKMLDPAYYDEVDLKNHKRILHALEICLMTGKPYSSLRKNEPKVRPFNIVKVGLFRDRDELYNRINKRVDQMMTDGLYSEAENLYEYRNLNSLNTVGYKELFLHFDGKLTLQEAIEKIKQNTRIYSKKQMTWFKRDPEIQWFNPDNFSEIVKYIDKQLNLE